MTESVRDRVNELVSDLKGPHSNIMAATSRINEFNNQMIQDGISVVHYCHLYADDISIMTARDEIVAWCEMKGVHLEDYSIFADRVYFADEDTALLFKLSFAYLEDSRENT